MKKTILIAIFLSILLLPALSLAAPEKKDCETDKSGQVICKLQSPLLDKDKKPITDPAVIIGLIIKGFLGIVGALSLFMMVWGGFGWMTAAGNPEKVKQGSKTMIWAAVGVLVVFISYMWLNGAMQVLFGKK